MSSTQDTDQNLIRIQLSELYLARRVSIEAIRDCSVHTSARINRAFIMEIITLLYKSGISIESEVAHLNEIGELDCAKGIKEYLKR